nr:gamma-glutamyltransferase [Alicyclobacillus mengziensis]
MVKPTENGIGGDAFALIWANGQMHGLNSSGPSPMGISANKVQDSGHRTMPKLGWLPVTVPGTPAAWAEINSKFGQLPFSKVLEPAIRYAERGHAVSPVTHKYWDLSVRNFQSLKGRAEFEGWFCVCYGSCKDAGTH